jgi:hypothetical protein
MDKDKDLDLDKDKDLDDEKDLDLDDEDEDLDDDKDKDLDKDKDQDKDKDKGNDKKESLEDRRARLQRELKRTEKKLGVNNEDKSEKKSKPGEIGYAEKSYLLANGIKKDEFALVQDVMKATGKDIDSVLDSKYFQGMLKDHRDDQAAKDALPKNSKRTGQHNSNSVEYWLAKGEMPADTPENRKLRQDIVNAKINKQSGSNSNFTSTPVIGGSRK